MSVSSIRPGGFTNRNSLAVSPKNPGQILARGLKFKNTKTKDYRLNFLPPANCLLALLAIPLIVDNIDF
jgi:hypothetical protein